MSRRFAAQFDAPHVAGLRHKASALYAALIAAV